MSEAVERRLLELLDHPTESPYGNPIPGLDELGASAGEQFMEGVVSLDSVVAAGGQTKVQVRRISEELQKDEALMGALRRVGALPDRDVTAARGPVGVLMGSSGETAEVDHEVARHIFVRRI
jgi:DtxR family Mn-dependent transcriptional regulator